MAKEYLTTDLDSFDFENVFLPSVAVDAVIFGVHDKALKVLLLQYKNTSYFALPGGFLFKEDNLYDAAQRILTERTGLPEMYLEQFFTFGDYGRSDPFFMEQIMEAN